MDAVEALPWPGFPPAAQAAVRFLHDRFPWDLWMVSQLIGDRQVVVASTGHWASLARPGDEFRWVQSFCHRLIVDGRPVAVADVPVAPGQAPAAGALARTRAYIGVPLLNSEGTVVGTLCALHREPDPSGATEILETASLLGRLLSTVLAAQQTAADRSAEAAAAYALTTRDPLTGVLNERGWHAAFDAEDQRARRYGRALSVVLVELDGREPPGDGDDQGPQSSALLTCARILADLGRPGDLLGRIGADQFALVAVESDVVCARALTVRIREALRSAGIGVSSGTATRRVGEERWKTLERAHRDLRRGWQHRRPHPTGSPQAHAAGRRQPSVRDVVPRQAEGAWHA